MDIYNVGIITIWAVTFVSFWIVTAILKSKNSSWDKFFGAMFFSLIISGSVMTFLLSSPEAFENLSKAISEFFVPVQ